MSEKLYTVESLESGNAGTTVVLSAADGGEGQTYLVKRHTVKSLGIHEGDTVDGEIVKVLFEDAELGRAEARMVRILSYSDHSCQALVRKLVSYGFSKEIAERAAERAVELGYIKETEQAIRCADYYIRRKYWGKKRIAMELMSHGYAREAIVEAVSSIDDELFCATLEKLIEKKYPQDTSDAEEKKRRISSILRMGYSVSEINTAMRSVYKK